MINVKKMKLKNAIFLLASTVIFSGCYLHYPSIGVSSHRVRPTDWRGRRCVLTINSYTGKKQYVCGPVGQGESRYDSR